MSLPFLSLLSRAGVVVLLSVCFSAAAEPTSVPGLILPFQEVEVGTAAAGLVAEVLVKEGDTVEEGQPILRLNDEVERLEVERAARVLEKARFDHDAAEKLLAEKIGTREDALKKRIEHDLASLALQAAQLRLAQRTIRAPIQGILVRRDKEPGEAVQLDETVAQVVHIRRLYAQFYLEPAQVRLAQPGQSLNLRVPSLPEQPPLSARIDFIDPRMDAESGLYRIKLLLDNADLRLKAGMRAELLISGP